MLLIFHYRGNPGCSLCHRYPSCKLKWWWQHEGSTTHSSFFHSYQPHSHESSWVYVNIIVPRLTLELYTYDRPIWHRYLSWIIRSIQRQARCHKSFAGRKWGGGLRSEVQQYYHRYRNTRVQCGPTADTMYSQPSSWTVYIFWTQINPPPLTASTPSYVPRGHTDTHPSTQRINVYKHNSLKLHKPTSSFTFSRMCNL